MKDEDFIDKLFIANTHDTLLCFSNRGQVYWIKVYELPQASRNARGKPLVNLLPLQAGERITAVQPVREFGEDQFLFFATSAGTVKKTPLSEYSRPRTAGIIAIDLRDGDELVDVAITDGRRDIMLFTDAGKAIRFAETDVRPMGRNAAGVRGIRFKEEEGGDDETVDRSARVIALVVVVAEGDILTVTENGYGKRTPPDEYPLRGRGGQGVISIQTSERNGSVVGAVQVDASHDVMLITDGGTLVRTRVAEISVLSRNTQGVRLIHVQDEERVIAVERIETEGEEAEDAEAEPGDVGEAGEDATQ